MTQLFNPPQATPPQCISIITQRIEIQNAVEKIKNAFERSQAAFSGKSYSLSKSIERRTDERVPVELPIFMKPIVRSGQHILILDDQPVMGFTHDFSSQGFGFSYDQAVRSKHVLVEFDLYNIGSMQLVAELRWSRKKDAHAFVGGALVVGILPS